MSIFTYLKKDHQHVKDIIKQIEALDSKDTEQRDKLFNKLKTEILLHSKAEDKIFYNPLKTEEKTKEDIPHAKKDHAEVEEMLERLSDKSLNGAAWTQLFKHMCQALFHHIDEEENQIFKDAKRELSAEDERQMEEAMKKEKKHVEEKLHISLRQ